MRSFQLTPHYEIQGFITVYMTLFSLECEGKNLSLATTKAM